MTPVAKRRQPLVSATLIHSVSAGWSRALTGIKRICLCLPARAIPPSPSLIRKIHSGSLPNLTSLHDVEFFENQALASPITFFYSTFLPTLEKVKYFRLHNYFLRFILSLGYLMNFLSISDPSNFVPVEVDAEEAVLRAEDHSIAIDEASGEGCRILDHAHCVVQHFAASEYCSI